MTSPIVDRSQLPNAGRVVVKIGSSSLTRADGRLNVPALRKLVDVLAEQSLAGKQVVLVSSGAIAAGFMPLGYDVRPSDVAGAQPPQLWVRACSWRSTPTRSARTKLQSGRSS